MDYTDVKGSAPVVLVEFYASWCPHCQRMTPAVEKIKQQLEGQVPVYQYDIDRNRELSDKEGIETIPTFRIYKDSKLVWEHTGEIDGAELLAKVKSQQ